MKNKFRLSNDEVEGLHRRPLYNELIGMLDKPLITSYPDRKATNLRNSNWLQQLDGNYFEAIKQLNHNSMKDQEKQNLLRQYAMASGVPLQEVKSMHTQTAKEPEYHNMAAGDDEEMHAAMDVEDTPFQHLFDPHVDVKHEDLYKTVARQPMRSKTKDKIQKDIGLLKNPNTNRKKKMADEGLDDENTLQQLIQDAHIHVLPSFQQTGLKLKLLNALFKGRHCIVNDAEIEALQKTVKKSAFNKLAQQDLQLVKTDVDAKTKSKKKGHKKHDDEDELAKIDKQTVNADEIRDLEQVVETRPRRNFQQGGSSSSKAPPKPKKRNASKSPETLRYDDPESSHEPKNIISQRAIKNIEKQDLAISSGVKIDHHPTFGAWKIAVGSRKDPLHQQMNLRKLPFNKQTTIAAMINKIMEFDKK